MKPVFLAGQEKKFSEFISDLNEKDRIAILTHTDADGLCSVVIASKVLGKIDYIKFVSYQTGIYKQISDELKKKKINKVLFLDLAFGDEKEDVKEIEKFADILVIDHHPFSFDLNSSKMVFIKAESKYPASYMCYYLFSKIQKIPSWITAIGILADMPQKYCYENCNSVFKDFSLEDSGNLWEITEDVCFALSYLEDNHKKVYDILLKAKSLDELNLKKYADIARKEFNDSLKKCEKEKETYGDLVFCYLNLKYQIKYLLINKISSENQDKTFVFVKDGAILSISARSQKIDCNELIKRAIKGLPSSSGGGHVCAAGGRLPREYLEKFKKNLIRVYRDMTNSSS